QARSKFVTDGIGNGTPKALLRLRVDHLMKSFMTEAHETGYIILALKTQPLFGQHGEFDFQRQHFAVDQNPVAIEDDRRDQAALRFWRNPPTRPSAFRMFSAELAYESRRYPSPRMPKSGPPISATPVSSNKALASGLAIQPVCLMLGKA